MERVIELDSVVQNLEIMKRKFQNQKRFNTFRYCVEMAQIELRNILIEDSYENIKLSKIDILRCEASTG